MYLDDEKHTFFQTLQVVYSYVLMSFGLKNTRAIYQWAIIVIFRNHLQKIVECYIHDIVVQGQTKEDHIKGLRTIFDLIWAHQLKMNPTKSSLGVSNKKFLGYVATLKCIQLDPDKVKVIYEM